MLDVAATKDALNDPSGMYDLAAHLKRMLGEVAKVSNTTEPTIKAGGKSFENLLQISST